MNKCIEFLQKVLEEKLHAIDQITEELEKRGSAELEKNYVYYDGQVNLIRSLIYNLDRDEPLVTVLMVDILRSNNPKAWEQFCDRYDVNVWAFSEGLVDDGTTCQITEEEKELWL